MRERKEWRNDPRVWAWAISELQSKRGIKLFVGVDDLRKADQEFGFVRGIFGMPITSSMNQVAVICKFKAWNIYHGWRYKLESHHKIDGTRDPLEPSPGEVIKGLQSSKDRRLGKLKEIKDMGKTQRTRKSNLRKTPILCW